MPRLDDLNRAVTALGKVNLELPSAIVALYGHHDEQALRQELNTLDKRIEAIRIDLQKRAELTRVAE